MVSVVSGLYLTKASSYSYLTATLQITISDFLQGKYTHACNCKQNFQQTGSLSSRKNTEAEKALSQKVIICNFQG